MKIFIFGEIYKNIAILNFTQNMYSLTDAGISFPESLKMCANSGNVLLNEEVCKIIFRLEKGAGIGKSFEKLSF
ncbi:MAG: type II secretion system F family protein, partial [Leptotrichia sp.]|nr:type II secretion system F family protein [Leptotrichia sp.]